MTPTKSPYWFKLDPLGLIKISGADAARFLQGQLTCDVNQLSTLPSSLGACCDSKGRVLFSFYVFTKDDAYYLCLPSSMIDGAITHLRKYVIIAKVQLEKCENIEVLGLVGINLSSDASHSVIPVDPSINRQLVILNSVDFNKFHEAHLLNSENIHTEYWTLLNIEQGIATIYPETQALFTPQMLNYEKFNAVSFNKGCYVGQEIIARTQHLGKLKRHLHQIQLSENAKPGDELKNAAGTVIGAIVECAQNKDSQFSALAVIQDQGLEEVLYCGNKPIIVLQLDPANKSRDDGGA